MNQAELVVVEGAHAGTRIPLGPEIVIGRASPPPLELGRDTQISRRHTRITMAAGGFYVIEDLESTNGTFLNGWRFPSPQVLSGGDRIQMGQSVLEVHLPEAAARASALHRRPAQLAGAGEADEAPSGVLFARGVTKSYGDNHVLKGVDLEIQPGEICGLLGSNGAGKTSFVSIVAGLRKADGGRVFLKGVDALGKPREARRHLGIAPQDLGLYPTMTVRRNFSFFGEIAGLRGQALSARVEEVAEALSLTPKLDSLASTLSGGQQRRLHTGMAILHKPSLLILDEPTVGADIRTREEILELVRRLAAEGHGVCYSTHYLPEIEALGASVAILDAGKIIARGSIADLVAKHGTTAVELQFDGPAPEIRHSSPTVREGNVLRISTQDPTAEAARVMAQLGSHALSLVNVDIIQPSLDSVYLALTERRYESGEQQQPNGGLALGALPQLQPQAGRSPVGV